MDELKDLNLEQMNWELCIANLDDAIKYLQECRERLEKALHNSQQLRDNEGNWFVRDGAELYPVEFSSSMEIAYIMGKIAALDQLRGEMNENLMQIRDSQIPEGMETTSLQK